MTPSSFVASRSYSSTSRSSAASWCRSAEVSDQCAGTRDSFTGCNEAPGDGPEVAAVDMGGRLARGGGGRRESCHPPAARNFMTRPTGVRESFFPCIIVEGSEGRNSGSMNYQMHLHCCSLVKNEHDPSHDLICASSELDQRCFSTPYSDASLNSAYTTVSAGHSRNRGVKRRRCANSKGPLRDTSPKDSQQKPMKWSSFRRFLQYTDDWMTG